MKISNKLMYLFICTAAIICTIFAGCSNSNSIKENGIKYTKVTHISDGKSTEGYDVSGCDSDIEILNIPSSVKGLPVLGFSSYAFEGNTKLKEITIPDTIKSISSYSAPFKDCTNIEKVTTISTDIMYLFTDSGRSDNNREHTIPASVKYIYLSNGCTSIGYREFYYCSNIKEIHIPKTVTTIKDGTNLINIGVNGHSANNNRFSNLPFIGCTNLTIYCETKSKPDGWETYWNYTSENSQAKTVWGATGYSDKNSVNTTTPKDNKSDNTIWIIIVTVLIAVILLISLIFIIYAVKHSNRKGNPPNIESAEKTISPKPEEPSKVKDTELTENDLRQLKADRENARMERQKIALEEMQEQEELNNGNAPPPYSDTLQPAGHHGFLAFIIVLIFIGILVFTTIKLVDCANNPSNTDGTPKLTSRSARYSDVSITQSTEFTLTEKFILVPNVDIDNLEITMNFLNSSHDVIKTKTKTIGNVVEKGEYSFSFKITEFSFTEIMNIEYWNYSVTGGTVSYFS